MSDEKIQIEIQDKVAPSIETKLDGITASARSGYDAIERMKQALNRLDAGALNALSLAHTRAQKAINDQAIATQRLRTEEQRTQAATIASATAQQRLQTAATQTASAQQALAAATSRANAAEAVAAREAANAAAAQSRAASAALRLQQARERQTRATQDLNREGEQLKRQLFPLYDAQQRYNEAVNRANLLLSQGAIEVQTYHAAIESAKGRLDAATAAQNAFTAAQTRGGKAAQIHRHHLTNLGFQLNDIGVSLASGQNPLIVLVQQGSQIAGIASQAGVGLRALAVAAAGMLAPLVPVVALIGALYAGIKLLASEASQGAGLKEYAKELGATDKQIKKLNLSTVTFGDTMRGLWRTIDDATGIGDIFSRIGSFIKSTFLAVLKTIAGAVTSIVALFQAGYDTIVELWQTFPNRFALFMANAVNSGIGLFENFVNFYLVGINKIIEGLNKVSGTQIEAFEMLKFDRIDTSKFETGAKDLVDVFVDSYVENLENNQAAIQGFIAKWQANSIAAAKERIRTALEDDKAMESRAAALAKINAQLDNELSRMYMLRPEREAQQRFDQIEEQLIGRKIKLNDEEAASIRRKIAAIQEAAEVQKQFDALYDAAVGPARTYNATLEAAERLLRTNPELQEQVNRSLVQAREAYMNTVDPLRQINKEIDQQNALLAMLPPQREVAQQLQQIENQLLAQGIVLTREQSEALRYRLQVQREMNIASQSEAQIWEATRGAREKYIADLEAIAKLKREGAISGGEAAQQVINSNVGLDFTNTNTEAAARVAYYDDMYKRIEELRQKDLINEQTAAALRLRVWNQQHAAQLETAAGFFGHMSQLQKSESSKVATIGKAAAISKAIIDTYTAATGAYASLASIPYVGPALGAAAAAAAITAGMANVQAIRSQGNGFKDGGYTGNIPRDAIAGNVHGQEYVMDAAATRRIGVANLDAMRRGAAGVQTNAGGAKGQPVVVPPAQVNQKFVTVLDPSIVGDYLAPGSEGEEVVLNIVERNPQRVSASVNGA